MWKCGGVVNFSWMDAAELAIFPAKVAGEDDLGKILEK